MNDRSQSRLKHRGQRGFTLLEALVAMAVGMVVVGAGVLLFQQASNSSRSTLSKTEMEQNGRAALNFVMQDISMANTDYQLAGIRVPQTGTTMAVFGCAGCTTTTFPNNMATPVVPYDKNSLSGTSDTITVIYVDNTWPPTAQNIVTKTTPNPPCPCATISTIGDQITITTAKFPDANGVLRDYQDTLYGSKPGDVMVIWNSYGHVLATVTGVASGGVLTLANADALHLNQTAAGAFNVAALKGTTTYYPDGTAVSRVKVVTYFVQSTPGPDGISGTSDDIPVLMRQVNGDPAGAQMVTDYVQNLQLTYDLYDPVANKWQFTASGFGGPAPTVTDPTQIRKINIAVQIRSQSKNSSGNYDTTWVSSSVGPRNLSFKDLYN